VKSKKLGHKRVKKDLILREASLLQKMNEDLFYGEAIFYFAM